MCTRYQRLFQALRHNRIVDVLPLQISNKVVTGSILTPPTRDTETDLLITTVDYDETCQASIDAVWINLLLLGKKPEREKI